ncbi:formyltransferase family protein [Roseivirga sp.]|uniref:formyltransferase family protein n=1 Tax=Roseivirga sp. TaxID=1964215 RepID=UPI003B8CEF03
MNYILLTEKKWHDELFESLSARSGENWLRISDREAFNAKDLKTFEPDKIFIPHWSYIIPASIYEQFECIVFHMTDLPFGRGGSPLQNLIVRGHEGTRVSALKVGKGIDTGDIYTKADLSLHGTAQEIFIRSGKVIGRIIEQIIAENPVPRPQEGEPTSFDRRKPEDGDLASLNSIENVFDFIRMLDCEGYPKAFIETEHFRIEFSRAGLAADKSIVADVRIFKK